MQNCKKNRIHAPELTHKQDKMTPIRNDEDNTCINNLSEPLLLNDEFGDTVEDNDNDGTTEKPLVRKDVDVSASSADEDSRGLVVTFILMVVVGSVNKIFFKLQTVPMVRSRCSNSFYYIF